VTERAQGGPSPGATITAVRRPLVAAFVAFHVAAMLVCSIPTPDATLARGGTTPEIDAAFAAWHLGDLEPAARRVVGAWTRAWIGAQGVFRPYLRVSGAQQGWSMFGHVATKLERFEVWVRHDGVWAPLYVARSDTADWRWATFDHERMRTFLHHSAKGNKGAWRRFADWVAAEVEAEDPTAEAVRVQFVAVEIPPAEELARTRVLREGKPFRVETRELGE
jgi:hypothetical protein